MWMERKLTLWGMPSYRPLHGLLSYCSLFKSSLCNWLKIGYQLRVPDLWVSVSYVTKIWGYLYNSPKEWPPLTYPISQLLRWYKQGYTYNKYHIVQLAGYTSFKVSFWGNHGRRLRWRFPARCLPSNGTYKGGKVGYTFKSVFSNLDHIMIFSAFPLQLTSSECHKTSIIRSQHWPR